MIAFLAQPIYMLILAVFQITLLEFFSIGSTTVDAGFTFVVYAGFYIGGIRGVFLSFLLGFFLDCIVSPVFGLNMFLYVLFFYISVLSSARINKENKWLFSMFSGAALFVQGLFKAFFFWLILDVDMVRAIPTVFLPQAVVTGILSPIIYNVFHYLEVLYHAEVRQPARRL